MTQEELKDRLFDVIEKMIWLKESHDKLKLEVAELKKQLPMQITEDPFDADPGKSPSDYTNTKPKVEYTTNGAPVWEVWFKINTSEDITEKIIEVNAWTEKQAIYLGRTEKLFPVMCELVKTKQIQPKWNILDAVAIKKD